MSWWKKLITWFVESGAAKATGTAIIKKVTKKDKESK